MGTKQSLMSKFLNLEQITYAAFTLNRIGFQVFKSEQTKAQFKDYFLADLKDVLSRLHNRDERNKLFLKDFWIIDKKLADGVADMNF